jgi:uncharacterized membrane protein YcfT
MKKVKRLSVIFIVFIALYLLLSTANDVFSATPPITKNLSIANFTHNSALFFWNASSGTRVTYIVYKNHILLCRELLRDALFETLRIIIPISSMYNQKYLNFLITATYKNLREGEFYVKN